MSKVVLNVAEQKLARFVAKQRYESARKQGVHDGKMGPQSNEDTDLEGIGAEIAYCKVNNVYPDLDVSDRKVFPVEDAVTRQGATVDVKSTKYQNGHLLAVMGKVDKKCDVYALVIGTFPSYRIAGVQTGKRQRLRTW
jgi:hypothetical protein